MLQRPNFNGSFIFHETNKWWWKEQSAFSSFFYYIHMKNIYQTKLLSMRNTSVYETHLENLTPLLVLPTLWYYNIVISSNKIVQCNYLCNCILSSLKNIFGKIFIYFLHGLFFKHVIFRYLIASCLNYSKETSSSFSTFVMFCYKYNICWQNFL